MDARTAHRREVGGTLVLFGGVLALLVLAGWTGEAAAGVAAGVAGLFRRG